MTPPPPTPALARAGRLITRAGSLELTSPMKFGEPPSVTVTRCQAQGVASVLDLPHITNIGAPLLGLVAAVATFRLSTASYKRDVSENREPGGVGPTAFPSS